MKYLILAGGAGTRLWPLSRKYYSKQFLSLINKNSMLQNTALRVSKEKGKDIFIITTKDSYGIIKTQLSCLFNDFNLDNIFLEPISKNTAPAIAYSSIFFDNNDVIAVLSSDHHIDNSFEFNKILYEAEKIANQGYIVTLGIIPNSPKTGYGYIEKSNERIGEGYKVNRFVEKPELKKAEEYLKTGNFFWNAGIFIFKIDIFFEELKRYSPDIYNITEKLRVKDQNVIENEYQKYPDISIDYALMEKSDKIVVIPADIGWSDIGSFKSLYEISNKDSNNNVVKMANNNFININSNNLLVYSNNRVIATIDINDLAIIDTEDSLLISKLNSSEKVKNVASELEKRNKKEFFYNKEINYEWGFIKQIDRKDSYIIEKILINPFRQYSSLFSKFSLKTLTVIKGEALIEKSFNVIKLKESESIILNMGEKYKIINESSNDVELIEIRYERD